MLPEPGVLTEAKQHVDCSDPHGQPCIVDPRPDARADHGIQTDESIDRGFAHLPTVVHPR